MDGLKQHVSDILVSLERLFLTRYQLLKLKTVDKTAETISSLVSILVIFFIAAVSFIVLSIGIAWWIGIYLKNMSNGFLIVGGFYVFICLLVFLLRRQIIKKPVKNHILNKFLD